MRKEGKEGGRGKGRGKRGEGGGRKVRREEWRFL